MNRQSLPLCQIALSSIDLERSEIWWREGLGLLPSAATRIFRGRGLSGVARLDNAAASTRWLVGQDEWLQVELWQYENPLPRLTAADQAPNHVGFSRCGVWVKDFDTTLDRLSALGSSPLSQPQGNMGERRVCVRDPDGIYVELFEKDPLDGKVAAGKFPSNAALRSVTITTEDLASSTEFARSGLGLTVADQPLHTDAHEALWNLDGADCQRETFVSGSMLLEYVYYHRPVTRQRHPHARLNDQGILNVAFGDSHSRHGIEAMELQANRAGAISSDRMSSPVAGCVYVTDPQGFSFEFVWAASRIGHRLVGFFPNNKPRYTLTANQRVEYSVVVDAEPTEVFESLADIESMPHWADKDKITMASAPASEIGQERWVHSSFFTLSEQITGWEKNRGYHYRASGGPFSVYLGELKLTPCEKGAGSGTCLTWTVRFRSKIPGLGLLLRYLINYQIENALKDFQQGFKCSALSET